jgi:uncharacterized protein (TIGR02270 family)
VTLAILPVIIEQHAEEAAFLWLLRDAAVRQPHYSLADLAKLDNRVEAHLDGLRIAGDPGWEICAKALEKGEAGEVFAAAVLAFESAQPARIQKVVKVGTASPEPLRGLVSALGWLTYPQVEKPINKFLADESPVLRRVGLAATALHRFHPHLPLLAALADSDPLLKARALRAVGELGLVDFLPTLRQSFGAADEGCRFWAAWSATLVAGDRGALAVLLALVQSRSPWRERALQLAFRRLEPSAAKAWQRQLSHDPNHLRLAVIGAGATGDPEWVPWLIEHMKDPPLARVAGEAFTMITGADLAYEDLERGKPEGFEAGPTENPEDEDVAMDPDDNLPWPNPEAVARWWMRRQGNFHNGTRYLLGQPINVNFARDVLRKGRQRQRAAAALELAIRQPGQGLFEVRAPGFRQQQLLASTPD